MKNINGYKEWDNVIGLRYDEPRRLASARKPNNEPWNNILPMGDAKHTVEDVTEFWSKQNFDLNLTNAYGKTPAGNCDLCFLKSEAQLAMIMKENPSRANWWIDTEKRFGKQFNRDRNLESLSNFVNSQQDWVFNQQGYFCQADSGECTG